MSRPAWLCAALVFLAVPLWVTAPAGAVQYTFRTNYGRICDVDVNAERYGGLQTTLARNIHFATAVQCFPGDPRTYAYLRYIQGGLYLQDRNNNNVAEGTTTRYNDFRTDLGNNAGDDGNSMQLMFSEPFTAKVGLYLSLLDETIKDGGGHPQPNEVWATYPGGCENYGKTIYCDLQILRSDPVYVH